MLKLSPMFSSLPAGRTLRAWLTHGTALLVLAGCAAVPGEPPLNANADKSAAPALKVPDVRDNPDAWGALSFRSVPDSSSLKLDENANTEPGLRADLGTFEQRGVASWYGRGFHGRRTASGERFDMNAFTVAHPSLPLQSWVLVRNLSNDQGDGPWPLPRQARPRRVVRRGQAPGFRQAWFNASGDSPPLARRSRSAAPGTHADRSRQQ